MAADDNAVQAASQASAVSSDPNEELKMDLAGYMGDFHRHRIAGDEIKKRIPLTEDELMKIMIKEDRLKEIALAFREIDPDRNGFLTQ